jgi:ribosomal protein S18 acetylase RimI-like enzyme
MAIRQATNADVADIRRVAIDSGLFAPDEVGSLADDLIEAPGPAEPHWLVLEREGSIAAAAYVGPEPYSDRVWNLYFIAVDANSQGRGEGSALLTHIRHLLQSAGPEAARLLLVETSGLPSFEATRAFYEKHGFVKEARIRDYYGDGDDKVIFRITTNTPVE